MLPKSSTENGVDIVHPRIQANPSFTKKWAQSPSWQGLMGSCEFCSSVTIGTTVILAFLPFPIQETWTSKPQNFGGLFGFWIAKLAHLVLMQEHHQEHASELTCFTCHDMVRDVKLPSASLAHAKSHILWDNMSQFLTINKNIRDFLGEHLKGTVATATAICYITNGFCLAVPSHRQLNNTSMTVKIYSG